MIRILVISDTHGDLTRLQDLVLNYPLIDYYLHLGDSEVPSYLLSPFSSVKGNCDHYHDYPPSRQIKTKYGYIHMEHFNTFLKTSLKDREELIFINGHTHIPKVEKIENKFLINPGSLNRPRDGSNGTYMMIEWSSSKIVFTILEYGASILSKHEFVL